MRKEVFLRSRVSSDLKNDFLAAAEAKGLTESAAVKMLADEFVKQYKLQKQRDEETLDALADAQSGLVVDGDAVKRWLDTWGSDNELKAPT